MFAKYIDENTIQIGSNRTIIKYDDIQVINPKDEDFIKAGYKELVIDEEPNYDMETEFLEPTHIKRGRTLKYGVQAYTF